MSNRIPADLNPQSLHSLDSFSHAETKPITMELARKYASMPIVADRKLSEQHLRKLADTINSGHLLPFKWADCFCCEDSVVYRINGQHSSNLLVSGRIALAGTAIIEHFVVQTKEEVRRLWSMLDSDHGVRSKEDVLIAMKGVNEDLEKLPITLLGSIQNALAYANYGHCYSKQIDRVSTSELLLKNVEFAKWCCKIFPSTKLFSKAGVLYAAYITYNQDRVRAEIFWNQVVTNVGITEKNSPALVLSRRLARPSDEGPSNGSQSDNESEKKPNRRRGRETANRQWHDFANISLRAWQGWLNGEEMTQIMLGKGTSGMAGLERFITQTAIGKIVAFHPPNKKSVK